MADITGVPEGLTEEALPKAGAIQGVPEGLTEEALPAVTNPTTAPAPKPPSTYESLTAPDDPGAREFGEKHPVLGPVVRGLGALGGAVMGMPGAIAHTFSPATEEEKKTYGGAYETQPGFTNRALLGAERLSGASSIPDARDFYEGKQDIKPTAAGIKSVLPEALGQGAGVVVGGELMGKGAGPATRGVGRVLKTAGEHASDIGAVTGGAAGATHGPGGVAYGTYTGGRIGKIVGKPLEVVGGAMSKVGMTPGEKLISTHEDLARKADKVVAKAEEAHSIYAASEAKGPIDPEVNPAYKKSMDALEKARTAQAEAHFHLQEAKESVRVAAEAQAAEVPEHEPTAADVDSARPEAPEAPTPTKEENDAKLSGLMDQVAPEKPEADNVRRPGQTQPETFPQERTAAPAQATGLRQLGPEGKGGVMGRQLALPAPREAEGVPEQPKAAEPVPEAPKPATAAEMAGMKAVGGKVTEAPEKAVAPLVAQGLKEGSRSAKPVALAPPEPKTALGRIPDTSQAAWQAEDDAEFERKVATLRAGKAAEAPKTAPERSPEDMSKVDTVVKELPNQDLIRHGARFGVDESKYDFSKREATREGGSKHPVEREAHANATVNALPEALRNHIVDAANAWDAKDTSVFDQASRSGVSRAERARSIMQEAMKRHTDELAAKGEGGGSGAPDKEPKQVAKNASGESDASLEAINRAASQKAQGIKTYRVNQSGNRIPVLPADAADAHANRGEHIIEVDKDGNETIKDSGPGAGPLRANKAAAKVGTEAGAKQDTDHFAQAKKELPNGTLSEQAMRAQDLKHDAAIVEEHNAGTGSSILKDGKKVEDGYVVGINKELENSIDGEKITPEDVKAYRERPDVQKALKGNPKAFIGTWVDGGKTYFDTSVPEPDLETAKKLGKANEQKAIRDIKGNVDITLAEEPRNLPAGYPKTEEEAAAKITKEGGVGGGAPGKATKAKALPTGDDLIKKYGESDGDPAHTAFILPDGRGVAQTGTVHDEMLGGKMTDADPPRERFIEQGNIRVRAHGVYGNRETALSIPDRMTPEQLTYLKKMSPMLRSGAVMIEGARPGSAYRTIDYGKATDETLESTIRELSQIVPANYPKGTPEVGGGAPSAAAAPAKELPELAEKHLTPEEKAGVLKSPAQTEKFVQRMSDIPEVHEYVDIANAGSGARKWYQRSAKAFDAMTEEAPEYFKDGDKDRFLNLLAASSPRQSVAMNLRETLKTWKAYVDAGRPEGDALKSLLDENLTPAVSKTPNALKALNGEEMWPDITKNKNFKVPSFAKNLRGWLGAVTSDGWMSLFAGLDPREISSAHSYHPLSVAVRAAAEELGWEPAEAQAAIWSFTQALQERGEELPEEVRKHSEDFVDLMAHDPQVRDLLADLGVTHANLDAKLAAIGEKPEVSSRTSPTTSRSVERLKERIETARGKGSIPPSKSAQGALDFREAPAHESRVRDADVEFDPGKFQTQTGEDTKLRPLSEKKKKSPLGSAKR